MKYQEQLKIYEAGAKQIVNIIIPDCYHNEELCEAAIQRVCTSIDSSKKETILIIDTQYAYMSFQGKNELIYAMKKRREQIDKVVFVGSETFAMLFNTLTQIKTEYFDPTIGIVTEIINREKNRMKGVVLM
jgi:hypothetical protein